MELKLDRVDPLDNAPYFTRTIVDLGNTFEPVALARFKAVSKEIGIGSNGFVPGMTPHSDFDWFTGTPDYILEAPDGKKCIVELKTHWYPSPEDAEPMQNMIKKHWLQVQAYLEILNIDLGYLFSWTIENGYTLFSIQRARDFWATVIWPQVMLFRDAFESGREVWPEYRNDILSQLNFRSGEKRSLCESVTCEMDKTTTQIEITQTLDSI